MKNIKFFSFIVKYFGFLKVVPLAPHVFDSLLRLWSMFINFELLDWIDEIESEVLSWEGTSISMHKYGGLQFNQNRKEIGHLHSNGLMDILYSRKLKQQLLEEGRIRPHHLFNDTGWISFIIQSKGDVSYALSLLKIAYESNTKAHSKCSRTK